MSRRLCRLQEDAPSGISCGLLQGSHHRRAHACDQQRVPAEVSATLQRSGGIITTSDTHAYIYNIVLYIEGRKSPTHSPNVSEILPQRGSCAEFANGPPAQARNTIPALELSTLCARISAAVTLDSLSTSSRSKLAAWLIACGPTVAVDTFGRLNVPP